MKTYDVAHDMQTIRDILGLSQEMLSSYTSIPRITIARAETNSHELSIQNLEKFYNFVFLQGIKLNEVQSDLLDDNKENRILLFHGSKTEIKNELSIEYSRDRCDFGKAFYLGETYKQAVNWVNEVPNSSVYAFYFDGSKLKSYEFSVDDEWMMAVLYFRGRLEEYKNSEKIKNLLSKLNNYDYFIAPIADNSMYEILNKFANGEITNEQCKHALSANDLGKQYVFKNDSSLQYLENIKRFYISIAEREYNVSQKYENKQKVNQKIEFSMTEYRRKGLFIDEYFK